VPHDAGNHLALSTHVNPKRRVPFSLHQTDCALASSNCIGWYAIGLGEAMNSAGTWFGVLLAVGILAPYLLGARPRTKRDWLYLALTIAFLAWLLPLMAPLRSR
jgi:hypothetical protein